MTRRIALAGTVAALAATVFLLGSALSPASEAEPAAPRASLGAEVTKQTFAGFSLGNTTRLIDDLQSRVRARPDDARSLTLLGLAYQQRARETGDTSFFPKSEGVLRRALALTPNDPLPISGLASLALARHRFLDALALGRRALRRDARAGRNWGIVGDSLLELGRYKEAFRAFDTMVRVEPDLPAYARISYARELLGRPEAAIEPMRAAVEASGFEQEPYAWSRVQLGKLFWSMGRLEAARREYRAALAAFPGYVYSLDALAHAEAAGGRLSRAIALERRAVETMPLPQFVAALGDLYAAAGRKQLAQRQYELMGALDRLLASNGVKTDLETALFNVDHGIRLGETLRRARLAQRDRPSIQADDVLAWALVRNGRCGEAIRYSQRALRLGTKDALIYFHRGMGERCLGRDARARDWFKRALALNPHFSVRWAPVAKRYAS